MNGFLGFVALCAWLFMGGRALYILMKDVDNAEGTGVLFLLCIVLAPFAYGFATILPSHLLSKAPTKDKAE